MCYKIERDENVKKCTKFYKLPAKTLCKCNLLLIICNNSLQNSLKVSKDTDLLMTFR